MTLIDKRDNSPKCYVTLETSPIASNVLCVFENNGSHRNFGSLAGPDLMQEFIIRGMGLLKERFDLGKIEQLTDLFEIKGTDRSNRMTQGSEGNVRPSNRILASWVADTIDNFITSDGVSEFSSNRFHLVIDEEYRMLISEPRLAENALVSVPLNALNLTLDAVREGGSVRHVAVDRAANSLIERYNYLIPPPIKDSAASFTVLYLLAAPALSCIQIALDVQRVHDLNFSGWWAVAANAVGFVGGRMSVNDSGLALVVLFLILMYYFILLFCRGTMGEKKYGRDPVLRRHELSAYSY
jgi:uncharacterized membrane protein YhaH (DUF805 family)